MSEQLVNQCDENVHVDTKVDSNMDNEVTPETKGTSPETKEASPDRSDNVEVVITDRDAKADTEEEVGEESEVVEESEEYSDEDDEDDEYADMGYEELLEVSLKANKEGKVCLAYYLANRAVMEGVKGNLEECAIPSKMRKTFVYLSKVIVKLLESKTEVLGIEVDGGSTDATSGSDGDMEIHPDDLPTESDVWTLLEIARTLFSKELKDIEGGYGDIPVPDNMSFLSPSLLKDAIEQFENEEKFDEEFRKNVVAEIEELEKEGVFKQIEDDVAGIKSPAKDVHMDKDVAVETEETNDCKDEEENAEEKVKNDEVESIDKPVDEAVDEAADKPVDEAVDEAADGAKAEALKEQIEQSINSIGEAMIHQLEEQAKLDGFYSFMEDFKFEGSRKEITPEVESDIKGLSDCYLLLGDFLVLGDQYISALSEYERCFYCLIYYGYQDNLKDVLLPFAQTLLWSHRPKDAVYVYKAAERYFQGLIDGATVSENDKNMYKSIIETIQVETKEIENRPQGESISKTKGYLTSRIQALKVALGGVESDTGTQVGFCESKFEGQEVQDIQPRPKRSPRPSTDVDKRAKTEE